MEEHIHLDWFSFWSGITPQATAITMAGSGQSFTYEEIDQRSSALAAGLAQQYQIRKGDRIGIIAKNCIEYIYLFAAAQKLGFILVPFNYRLTAYELEQLIQNADPKLIFLDEEFSLPNHNFQQLAVSEIQNIAGDVSKPLPSQPAFDDPVFILYTSGSSGVPKGVLYTHKMLFWNSANTSVSLGINGKTKALVTMPPFHTGGWNVLLTPVLHHGGHSIICERFDAEETLLLLKRYDCNQFMAVPTMLKMIAERPLFNEIKLPNLQYIIVGGEAMPLELIHTYENRSIAVRQGFGMTEAGPNLTSLHHDYSKAKLGSIGKPNMYVEILLVDEEGKPVSQGENGEMCLAGPIVTPGYWQKGKETVQINGTHWFKTGDIAMMDAQGFLYIRDRKKNMYISGGENVYPAEVEKVLLTHSQVKEVAIIGVAHEKWGEVGKAFVVAQGSLTIEDLITFCQERLSKYKVPKHFVFLDELPLNAAGKVDKPSLKGK